MTDTKFFYIFEEQLLLHFVALNRGLSGDCLGLGGLDKLGVQEVGIESHLC